MQKGRFLEADQKLTKFGDYQILHEWNYLEWVFEDEDEKADFYENEYYKGAMLAAYKVDSHGNEYISVPRWHPGLPGTLNKVVYVDGKALLEPFPSRVWNEAHNPRALQSILGFEIDENDVMWILDQGHICDDDCVDGDQKIVIWDLKANELVDVIPITNDLSDYHASFLNDICVDNENGYAYIADSGIYTDPLQGGLLVYNMKTKTLRRVLHQDISTQDAEGFTFGINGFTIYDDNPMRTGADGIALSCDRKTLYWCPLTGRRLYSIATELLWDESKTDAELSAAVVDCGSKHTNTDGMTADNQGRIWFTMLENTGMGYYDPADGEMHEFVQDERMVWVDTPQISNDGCILFTTNQLHFLNTGKLDFSVPNERVWRAYVGEDFKNYLTR